MDRIAIKIGKKIIFLKIEDIVYMKAEGGYVRIFNSNKSYLLSCNLKKIEKKLRQDKFCRINRSIIINLDFIKDIKILKDWNYCVTLKNEKSWKWGKKFYSNLKKLIYL